MKIDVRIVKRDSLQESQRLSGGRKRACTVRVQRKDAKKLCAPAKLVLLKVSFVFGEWPGDDASPILRH